MSVRVKGWCWHWSVPLQSSVRRADSIAAITPTFFPPSDQLRWREDAVRNKIVLWVPWDDTDWDSALTGRTGLQNTGNISSSVLMSCLTASLHNSSLLTWQYVKLSFSVLGVVFTKFMNKLWLILLPRTSDYPHLPPDIVCHIVLWAGVISTNFRAYLHVKFSSWYRTSVTTWSRSSLELKLSTGIIRTDWWSGYGYLVKVKVSLIPSLLISLIWIAP